jgi:hypothetical protein
MQPLFAIVGLTWKAAFRYRLFWVVTSLLLVAVVALPMLLKDDGTAAGFAQILLTYTLSAVTGLLGLCTLWLACGTLARDIEDCQIQMVAVKPIARWQIWAGKWLGLVSLDAALLAVAGLSIFGLLEFRARKLPEKELFKLKNEVLVARASVKEPDMEQAIRQETDREFKESLDKGMAADINPVVLRQQIALKVRADLQVVQPNETRLWRIPLGAAKNQLKDQPLYVRMKFNSAKMGQYDNLHALWQVGYPKKTAIWQEEMSVAPDTFYEFKIDPNLFDEKGDLYILFLNPNNSAVLFTLEDGLEVLYRQGGFGLNFVRGLLIILCWLGLLAALGLAAASFLSFPVAAFFSLALLIVTFSSGTLSNVVSDGTLMGFNEEKGTKGHSPVDSVAVPAFKGLLDVINLVQGFAPIDALSTGRLISGEMLGQAVVQIIVLLGGLLAAGGIFIFSRRELATAQGTQ